MKHSETTKYIARTFDELRGAIENRQYDEIAAIVADQRTLFQKLDFAEPGSLELLTHAQDLTNWALTLAKVQHAHAERAYAQVLCSQRVGREYKQPVLAAMETVPVRG